jgi:hypothetical protein
VGTVDAMHLAVVNIFMFLRILMNSIAHIKFVVDTAALKDAASLSMILSSNLITTKVFSINKMLAGILVASKVKVLLLNIKKNSDSVGLIVVIATITVPVAISLTTAVNHFFIFHMKLIAAVSLLVLVVVVIVGMDLVLKMELLQPAVLLFLVLPKENPPMSPML